MKATAVPMSIIVAAMAQWVDGLVGPTIVLGGKGNTSGYDIRYNT